VYSVSANQGTDNADPLSNEEPWKLVSIARDSLGSIMSLIEHHSNVRADDVHYN
jgi:hypothetical protein